MAEILRYKGHEVIAPSRIEMDIRNENSVNLWCRKFTGELDVLINNAGGLKHDFDSHMSLNARGAFWLTGLLWPHFVLGKTRVINVSSREGLSGDTFGNRLYSVSKAALNAVTRMHAAIPVSLSINACCPGPFKSEDPEACRKAADTPIWLATEAPFSTGKFYINREVVPW